LHPAAKQRVVYFARFKVGGKLILRAAGYFSGDKKHGHFLLTIGCEHPNFAANNLYRER
jgi:hypothetical protein